MSIDILVVDDEADIRDLVSGILEDEGFNPRAAANSDGVFKALKERLPALVVLDVWLQNSAMDGIEILAGDQEGSPRLARCHHIRARHDRDRGRGDQEGRLRLHRKTIQCRPAGSRRQSCARSDAFEARERRASRARSRLGADRIVNRDQFAPGGCRPCRRRKVARSHLRARRRRQGSDRTPPSHQIEQGGAALHRRQRRNHRARTHGRGAFRR